jgi:outer membrane lipoprotein LolB
MFELEGSEDQGELTLMTPLGSTLGKLHWTTETATLHTGQQHQQSDSLDALLVQVTGAALPVKAIFNWLRGVPSNAPGWVADLSGIEQGRITAQRVSPQPRATLRIALSR